MKTFTFNGKRYKYVDMKPNQTRVNERRVELALAFEFINNLKDDVVEIGNVTRHYNKEYTHNVVDLHEIPTWKIENADVLTWTPTKKYKGAISISTVEHIGEPILAINRILGFTKNALITFPVGYAEIEEIIKDKNTFYLKRISEDNEWIQSTYNKIKNCKYDKPFPFANAIGVIIK